MQLQPYSERKVGREPTGRYGTDAAGLRIVEGRDAGYRREVATEHCGGRHSLLPVMQLRRVVRSKFSKKKSFFLPVRIFGI